MGVAAAYLAEMISEDVKNMTSAAQTGVVGPEEPPSRVVVVAPQEGQVGTHLSQIRVLYGELKALTSSLRLEYFLFTICVSLPISLALCLDYRMK